MDSRDQTLLLNRAAKSVRWSTLTVLVPRTVTPISGLVLASLLAPADFGTVAAAMIVLSLAQIVLGMGLGAAVIQRRQQALEAASGAFWVSLIISVVLYSALWLASGVVAASLQIPELKNVIRLAGLSLPLVAVKSIPAALLQRDLEFRKLFWVEGSSPIVTAVVSIALATWGFGVWALVWGYLAGILVSALLAGLMSPWRPSLDFSANGLRSLFAFSSWILLANLQTWLFLSGDNAVAGYFLGPHELGVYSLGFNLSNLIPGLVSSSLSAVAYPMFCMAQNDPKAVGNSLIRIQALAAVIIFPPAFGMAAVGTRLFGLLYGSKWSGLGEVVRWIAIMPGLQHLWSLNADAFRAVGHPEVWPKIFGVQLLVLIPALIFVAPLGLIPFTWVRFAIPLVFVFMVIGATNRVLNVSLRDQVEVLAWPAACSLLIFTIARLGLAVAPAESSLLGWAALLGVILACAALYMALLWLTNRNLWNELLSSARQVLALT